MSTFAAIRMVGLRPYLAWKLRDLADRLDPAEAREQETRLDTLRRLGDYAYGGAVWSSVPTMVRTALERAQSGDTTWLARFR